MGRQLQDTLPTFRVQHHHKERNIKADRQKQKQYFDQKHNTINEQAEFHEGQKVAIQHHITKEWSRRGTIANKVAPRSYQIILTNGTTLRRNTRDIRRIFSLTTNPAEQQTRNPEPQPSSSDDENIPDDAEEGEESDNTIPYPTEEDGESDDTASYDTEEDRESDATTAYNIDENEETHSTVKTYVTRTGGRAVKKKNFVYTYFLIPTFVPVGEMLYLVRSRACSV